MKDRPPVGGRTRRAFLEAAGLGAAGMALGCARHGGTPAARVQQPNILFLFADDQRFDTLAALGNREIHTPHMDSLVRRGTALTHAFIAGSDSGAVCICSRSMLLTGRSLYRSPQTLRASDGFVLWPEAFRQAGYTTYGIGKWHNGRESFNRCFEGGASIFYGGMSDHRKMPVYDYDPTGTYPADAHRVAQGFSSEVQSDDAVDFLRRYRGEAPFLAYVSYTAPHDPRMAPREFVEMYPPESITLPPNFLPQHPFDNGEMRIRDERLAPWPRTPEVVRQHIAAYYAMITQLDAQIGRVLVALEASGRAGNTLVVFAGDNGLAVGQHGLFGKQNLYDHSLRVPLVLAGPGIPRGRRVEELVYLHDLFPTTCELAGLETPATVESRSMASVLHGEDGRECVFGAYKDIQRSVRTRRWKLIRYPKVGRTQLFDVKNDPWETRDLSGDGRVAARVAEMNRLLREEQAAAGDTLNLPRNAT